MIPLNNVLKEAAMDISAPESGKHAETALGNLLEHCERLKIHVLPGGIVCAKNAAFLIGLSDKTLANQRSSGGANVIPFTKQFGRVWYHISDLAKVFETKYVSTAQAQADRRTRNGK